MFSFGSSARMVCFGRWQCFRRAFRSSIGCCPEGASGGRTQPVAVLHPKETHRMKRLVLIASAIVGIAWTSRVLFAFCGFYVAKADTKLFNSASQVVLVRDGDRTVLTMANDFRGDPKEFAVVIPVPTAIQRDQIRVVDRALCEHIDAYSAPRLVEYFDRNPCEPIFDGFFAALGVRREAAPPPQAGQPRSLGVTIEAQYTIGEYDILILSARESTGLETWLRQNNYRI